MSLESHYYMAVRFTVRNNKNREIHYYSDSLFYNEK